MDYDRPALETYGSVERLTANGDMEYGNNNVIT